LQIGGLLIIIVQLLVNKLELEIYLLIDLWSLLNTFYIIFFHQFFLGKSVDRQCQVRIKMDGETENYQFMRMMCTDLWVLRKMCLTKLCSVSRWIFHNHVILFSLMDHISMHVFFFALLFNYFFFYSSLFVGAIWKVSCHKNMCVLTLY
jgi:hypothetical protein